MNRFKSVNFVIFFLSLLLVACSQASASDVLETESERPLRIISLDYCADQYVLKFADRSQILAVSPDAVKNFSYMRETAQGLPSVRPIAEDVLILKPDLIVRSYGGGVNAAAFFKRAGIPVLQIGWASDIDGGNINSIPNLIMHAATELGHPERGEALVEKYMKRLKNIKARSAEETVLYMSPGGVTTGPGSIAHEMMLTAGLKNFETEPGWRPIPLERLVYEQPDLVIVGFHERMKNNTALWSSMRHPVAQAQLSGRPVVPFQGAWTACGGWFLLEAIEALASGGQD